MLLICGLLLCFIGSVYCHGRLIEPPARSSMWRVGFHTPKNYNDNQLNCGGFMNQYLFQKGKCGICGDPYQGPKNNEAGGRYATGTIARTYQTGQLINIELDITADHRGWFEFKLCPNNNPQQAATQGCLDRYLLSISSSGTRYMNSAGTGRKRIQVKLPDGLSCTQCVLQWRWHAGNNYGVDPDGRGCVGCGSQEEFYGCADIAINGNGQPFVQPTVVQPTKIVTFQPMTIRPPTTQRPALTFKPIVTFRPFLTNAPVQTVRPPYITNAPVQTVRPPFITNAPVQTVRPGLLICKAINYWAGVVALDQWCTVECRKGNCPPTACTCQRT